MVLHDCPTAEIWPANSLSSPHFKDERNALRLKAFDYVVANPPFSQKNWTSGLDPANDLYGRFGTNPHDWGVPPPKNGDYAFLLHILTSLKSTGRGAVILPHGVLFRGGAEGAIRKKLVQQGGVTVNGLKLGAEVQSLAAGDAVRGRWFIVRKGGRDVGIVEIAR